MTKIVLSALVASSLVMAAEVADKNQLTTHTELGFIQTEGNTKTETFNLDLDAKKAFNEHLFSFSFDAQYAKSTEIETKNKFVTELGYSYSLTDKLSVTYIISYKEDKFSGFNYQTYTGPGLKYLVYKTKAHKLNIEGSILYSIDGTEDIDYDASGAIITYPNQDAITTAKTDYGETQTYASYRVKATYDWEILSNLKFNQELSFRAEIEDSEPFFFYSKTAFSSKISDFFSAGLSYKIDYVNTPPIGKDTTDRTLTANLIMDY